MQRIGSFLAALAIMAVSAIAPATAAPRRNPEKEAPKMKTATLQPETALVVVLVRHGLKD